MALTWCIMRKQSAKRIKSFATAHWDRYKAALHYATLSFYFPVIAVVMRKQGQKMRLENNIPLIEEILEEWRANLGKNYNGYKNHVYRVVNFCFNLHQSNHDDDDNKIIIAGCFHDIGIWVNDTFDYLEPSIKLAKKYLRSRDQDHLSHEIELMINMHHKITKYKNSTYPLVEAFRQADWVDVSRGRRSFGLSKEFIASVINEFPNSGFHKNLIQLTKAEFMKNPLKPLPMMKW